MGMGTANDQFQSKFKANRNVNVTSAYRRDRVRIDELLRLLPDGSAVISCSKDLSSEDADLSRHIVCHWTRSGAKTFIERWHELYADALPAIDLVYFDYMRMPAAYATRGIIPAMTTFFPRLVAHGIITPNTNIIVPNSPQLELAMGAFQGCYSIEMHNELLNEEHLLLRATQSAESLYPDDFGGLSNDSALVVIAGLWHHSTNWFWTFRFVGSTESLDAPPQKKKRKKRGSSKSGKDVVVVDDSEKKQRVEVYTDLPDDDEKGWLTMTSYYTDPLPVAMDTSTSTSESKEDYERRTQQHQRNPGRRQPAPLPTPPQSPSHSTIEPLIDPPIIIDKTRRTPAYWPHFASMSLDDCANNVAVTTDDDSELGFPMYPEHEAHEMMNVRIFYRLRMYLFHERYNMFWRYLESKMSPISRVFIQASLLHFCLRCAWSERQAESLQVIKQLIEHVEKRVHYTWDEDLRSVGIDGRNVSEYCHMRIWMFIRLVATAVGAAQQPGIELLLPSLMKLTNRLLQRARENHHAVFQFHLGDPDSGHLQPVPMEQPMVNLFHDPPHNETVASAHSSIDSWFRFNDDYAPTPDYNPQWQPNLQVAHTRVLLLMLVLTGVQMRLRDDSHDHPVTDMKQPPLMDTEELRRHVRATLTAALSSQGEEEKNVIRRCGIFTRIPDDPSDVQNPFRYAAEVKGDAGPESVDLLAHNEWAAGTDAAGALAADQSAVFYQLMSIGWFHMLMNPYSDGYTQCLLFEEMVDLLFYHRREKALLCEALLLILHYFAIGFTRTPHTVEADNWGMPEFLPDGSPRYQVGMAGELGTDMSILPFYDLGGSEYTHQSELVQDVFEWLLDRYVIFRRFISVDGRFTIVDGRRQWVMWSRAELQQFNNIDSDWVTTVHMTLAIDPFYNHPAFEYLYSDVCFRYVNWLTQQRRLFVFPNGRVLPSSALNHNNMFPLTDSFQARFRCVTVTFVQRLARELEIEEWLERCEAFLELEPNADGTAWVRATPLRISNPIDHAELMYVEHWRYRLQVRPTPRPHTAPTEAEDRMFRSSGVDPADLYHTPDTVEPYESPSLPRRTPITQPGSVRYRHIPVIDLGHFYAGFNGNGHQSFSVPQVSFQSMVYLLMATDMPVDLVQLLITNEYCPLRLERRDDVNTLLHHLVRMVIQIRADHQV